jgi:hypothetical protein
MHTQRQRIADTSDSGQGSGANVGAGEGAGVERDGGAGREVAREILRGCVCSRTRMLDRVLSRLFDDSLAPLGVRANQLTVRPSLGLWRAFARRTWRITSKWTNPRSAGAWL